MRKYIDLKDAIGRTFEGFVFSREYGESVLTFSGGVFATLQADHSVDWSDTTIEEGSDDLDNFSDEELLSIGVITQAEMDEKIAAEKRKEQKSEARDREERERRDFAEYERLKLKYEGKSIWPDD